MSWISLNSIPEGIPDDFHYFEAVNLPAYCGQPPAWPDGAVQSGCLPRDRACPACVAAMPEALCRYVVREQWPHDPRDTRRVNRDGGFWNAAWYRRDENGVIVGAVL